MQDIESLPLGVGGDQIIKRIGNPIESSKDRKFLIWRYQISSTDSGERASLTLEPLTRVLVEKLVIPINSEPEHKLEYLRQIKFPNFKFQIVEFPICDDNYSPTDAMAIDSEHGIDIRYRKNSNDVLGLGSGLPSQKEAQTVIDDIRACRQR